MILHLNSKSSHMLLRYTAGLPLSAFIDTVCSVPLKLGRLLRYPRPPVTVVNYNNNTLPPDNLELVLLQFILTFSVSNWQ